MERTTGSCKCKGNKFWVGFNISEMGMFTSTVTRTSYKISHNFDCNDKCLIYLLTCKTCLKHMLVVPQIGTTDIVGIIVNVMTEKMKELRLVCINLFFNILIVMGIVGSYMTFQFLWSIKLMQKILSNANTTLTTLAPHGLNIEDEF